MEGFMEKVNFGLSCRSGCRYLIHNGIKYYIGLVGLVNIGLALWIVSGINKYRCGCDYLLN